MSRIADRRSSRDCVLHDPARARRPPDDHPYAYLTMRNDAFREADLIIILGTRTNYVVGHALPPRFGPMRRSRASTVIDPKIAEFSG